MALEAAFKAVVYAAALLNVGAGLVYWVVLPRGGRASADVERRLRRVGVIASVVALLALTGRLGAHALSAFGWPDAWSGDALKVVALESQWGRAWQRELMTAAFACAAFLAARGAVGWTIAAIASVAAAASLALTGHAEGELSRLSAHGAHLVAAGAWIGSLGTMAALRRSASPPEQSAALERFSPLAMTAAAILAGSGLTAAYLYIGSVANLWTTDYGRLLLTKLALFAGVLVCGVANSRRLRWTGTVHGRTIAVELLLAALILIVTAWLTETAHP